MNDVEGAVELAWWKSKKLMAVLAHDVIVGVISIFGVVKSPQSSGVIIPAAITSVGATHGAHQVSQALTDRAQAYSPNYPLPPAPPPGPPGGMLPPAN